MFVFFFCCFFFVIVIVVCGGGVGEDGGGGYKIKTPQVRKKHIYTVVYGRTSHYKSDVLLSVRNELSALSMQNFRRQLHKVGNNIVSKIQRRLTLNV